MPPNAQFPHDLIKGKIAELIFELMFRDVGRFKVLRFGYDYALPELAQYHHLVEVKQVLENISNAPDFVLIEKNDDRKLNVFTVEVKYRANPDPGELKQVALST